MQQLSEPPCMYEAVGVAVLILGMLLRVGKRGCGKSFLLITALVTWLVYQPIMCTCYYACTNSVLNAHPRPGFPTLTLFNVLNVI